MLLRVLSFAVVASLAACANTVVFVPRTSPAEINLSSYQRIAVGGVSGPEGPNVVAGLTQALLETKRFEVLDRQHLAEVMKEQDLAVSGAVSDDSAVSIGQIIGSAALLVGDVSLHSYDEDVNRSNEKCSVKGKSVDCVAYTRTANAQVAVTFKVLDTETGKVLAAKNLTSSLSDRRKKYDDKPARFDMADAWLAKCRTQVVQDFMKVIAPYTHNVGVELLDDGDLPELEMGNNFAKLGRWPDAIAQYGAALERGSKDPEISIKSRSKALYNLGVGLGYSGSYDEGVNELEKAFAMKPDNLYLMQINRIKKFKEDDVRLAEQTQN